MACCLLLAFRWKMRDYRSTSPYVEEMQAMLNVRDWLCKEAHLRWVHCLGLCVVAGDHVDELVRSEDSPAIDDQPAAYSYAAVSNPA